MQEPRLITTSHALDALAAELRAAGRFALDTEFVWERTYRPMLGVVQVATDGGVAATRWVARWLLWIEHALLNYGALV